jgi:hypothetical protein
MRAASAPEFHKYFDDSLTRKPFALAAIYALLDNSEDRIYTNHTDVISFVDRAHLDIPEYDYAHFRYSPHNTLLRQRIQQFESTSD